MKTLIIIITLVLTGSFHPIEKANTDYHLICTGSSSKSYHRDYSDPDDYCRGLKSCRADIERLPADKAKARRSDPCNWCYN